MIEIPKPKMRPLTIEACTSAQLPRCVFIEALTEEAEAWVKEHAPEFGDLYLEFGKKWMLMVYRGYNREEVINYLLGKWDSEQWPEEIDQEIEAAIATTARGKGKESMSDYETIYAAEQDIAADPHGWIQWKGTDVCIDIHCGCGKQGHYDGDFAYAIRCTCGKIWALGQCLKLLPLTKEQAEGFNVKQINDPDSLLDFNLQS